jgi:hypothetical protein
VETLIKRNLSETDDYTIKQAMLGMLSIIYSWAGNTKLKSTSRYEKIKVQRFIKLSEKNSQIHSTISECDWENLFLSNDFDDLLNLADKLILQKDPNLVKALQVVIKHFPLETRISLVITQTTMELN